MKLDIRALDARLRSLAAGFDGRVGIAVQDSSGLVAVHGDQRFSLQSVMKLVVVAAVLNVVDQGKWHLEDQIVVRREDLSLNVQPLAELVTAAGYRTILGDLISRAVVDSDSAATDILFARVGRAEGIRRFLVMKHITGIRVDRDERHLQTETVGLTWRPEYVDSAVLDRAKAAVPQRVRGQAFQNYLRDQRDTATPIGMAHFLYALATGALLSSFTTDHLLAVMRRTVTFPDRLKAGIPQDWKIGHKTGTSQTWNGVTGVTNDVGILTAPDGHSIVVAVFLAESRRSAKDRAALMAQVARSVTAAYHD